MGGNGVGVPESESSDPHLVEISEALERLRSGDPKSTAALVPVVYNELRKLARSLLRRERPHHTLQATALVHETFLRLASQSERLWENRAQFIGFAARSMRQILVDHARMSNAAKRLPPGTNIRLEGTDALANTPSDQLVALDDALQRLEKLSERQSRIVELRFFGGLTVEDTAKVLQISEKTVKREWSLARAWLHSELQKE